MNRRHFVASSTSAVLAASTSGLPSLTCGAETANANATAAAAATPAAAAAAGPNAFTLDPLPYAFDALEPHFDAKTMETHHGKHHQAYVTKLNEALASEAAKGFTPGTLTELQEKLSSAPEAVRTALVNHGGGHFNHTFFWKSLGKSSGAAPAAPGVKLAAAIAKAFGTHADFVKAFSAAGMKVFGSGWTWFIQKADGSLAIVNTELQKNPLMKGILPDADCGTPLLGLDIWEHAYYLKYQNRRVEYIAAFWNVVDWKSVESRMAS